MFSFGTPLSCCFEADRANESVEVIDDALIKAVELRPLLLVDSSIRADGAEKAGGKRRIDALEELQEDQTDCRSEREELRAARVWKRGDEPLGPELGEIVTELF